MQLRWSSITRFHDWSAKDREVARALLASSRKLGLVGDLEWYTDARDRRVSADGKATLEALFNRKAPPRRAFGLNAGGERPTPWELALLIADWNKREKQVSGYNTYSVFFDSKPFGGEAASTRLAKGFVAAHTAQNTEFASIHPSERQTQLTDMEAPYERPVTYGPLFSGVYWATFLGPQHLALFDEAKLRALDAYRFELVPKTSLYVQVCADVADSTSPEVEAEMFRLTDAFRAALL